MNFKAIILAAGKGTRMKSKYPKVIHKVCGKEMVNHVISVSNKSGVKDIVAILGHGSEEVKEKLPNDTMIAMQTEQLGTGHAVMMAKDYINDEDTIVVLCGDTPLVKEETLKRLFDYHLENGYHTTVLTTEVENPTGYGRIIRDENQDLLKIVEQKDATEEEKLVKEINSGIYCFNGKSLRESLDLLVKNAIIEDGSKASHLSYIGDAHVGKNVNIGCGVVFVNYDGKNKFKSVVKDGAFIGSNSNLVAPVTVEEKGYIATGSTITNDVPQGALAIARERQVVKEGWVAKKDAKDQKNNK